MDLKQDPQILPLRPSKAKTAVGADLMSATPAAQQSRPVHSPNWQFAVRVIENPAELDALTTAWEALAEAALIRNVFYEPCMFLPAVRHLAGAAKLQIVVIEGTDAGAPKDRRLFGFFPLIRQRLHWALPLATLELWGHLHCFLRTPLIDAEHAETVLTAFFEWTRTSGARLTLLPGVTGEGSFAALMTKVLRDQDQIVTTFGRRTRGLLRRSEDGASYLHEAITGKRLKNYRRLEHRLAEQGTLAYQQFDPDRDDLDVWLEEFLQLEAAGWKGKMGSAMLMHGSQTAFFLQSARQAHAEDKLQLLRLRVGDRTVAMKCNFRSGNRGFAFKIAYDESYEKYSVGALLEFANIHYMHSDGALASMDSCCMEASSLFERVWKDLHLLESHLISNGGWLANAAARLLPVLNAIFRPRRPRCAE